MFLDFLPKKLKPKNHVENINGKEKFQKRKVCLLFLQKNRGRGCYKPMFSSSITPFVVPGPPLPQLSENSDLLHSSCKI